MFQKVKSYLVWKYFFEDADGESRNDNLMNYIDYIKQNFILNKFIRAILNLNAYDRLICDITLTTNTAEGLNRFLKAHSEGRINLCSISLI